MIILNTSTSVLIVKRKVMVVLDVSDAALLRRYRTRTLVCTQSLSRRSELGGISFHTLLLCLSFVEYLVSNFKVPDRGDSKHAN